jgi:hypothetical protein
MNKMQYEEENVFICDSCKHEYTTSKGLNMHLNRYGCSKRPRSHGNQDVEEDMVNQDREEDMVYKYVEGEGYEYVEEDMANQDREEDMVYEYVEGEGYEDVEEDMANQDREEDDMVYQDGEGEGYEYVEEDMANQDGEEYMVNQDGEEEGYEKKFRGARFVPEGNALINSGPSTKYLQMQDEHCIRTYKSKLRSVTGLQNFKLKVKESFEGAENEKTINNIVI